METFLAGQLNMKIPTSTWARKIGTPVASRSLDTAATTIMSTQMSHQASVGQKHQTLTAGAADATRAYRILEQLRASSKPSIPEEVKYKTWSREDTRRVAINFQDCINNDRAPSLDRCKTILSQYQGRSAKNLQDK